MVFEKVKAVLAEQLELNEDDITMDTRFVEDLKADSLDIVELVMDLEQEFDMEIPDEELAKIESVRDIVDYVEQQL